jgi:hypothetical protein
MCWSLEVTLTFVLIELAACAILWSQGKAWFLLVSSGVVIQEVIQLLLWYQIERDEASFDDKNSHRHRCSTTNTFLSLVEQVVVVGWVPFAWCVASQIECVRDVHLAEELVECEWLRALTLEPATTRAAASDWAKKVRYSCARAWQLAHITKRGVIYFTAATVTYSLYGIAAGFFLHSNGGSAGGKINRSDTNDLAVRTEGFCTIRGPIGGHQLWPFMDMPLPPSVRGWVQQAGARVGLTTMPGWRSLPRLAGSVSNTQDGLWGVAKYDRSADGIDPRVGGDGTDSTYSGGRVTVERAATVSFQLSLGLFYLLFLCVAMVLVRGRLDTIDSTYRQGWLPMGLTIALGPLLIGGLWLFIGGEYGSVWCWTASAAFLMMLVEPKVSSLMEKRHGRSDRSPSGPKGFWSTVALGSVLQCRSHTCHICC